MRNKIYTWFAATYFLVAASLAQAQQSVPTGAKVLLLPGGQRSHHAYRRQAFLLQKLLEDSHQFQVTICEDAAILETASLAKYDIVVGTADRRDNEFRLTVPQQRALLKFVHDGKGLFCLHAFNNADKTWVPEMREMLGGVLAHFGLPDTKVHIDDFQLTINDPNSPITAGVADFKHHDELYYHLQIQGELKTLVSAVYEGEKWPVIWIRNYGSGRVCVNQFGHLGENPTEKDPLEDPSFQKLVLQGIAWTAGKTLVTATK